MRKTILDFLSKQRPSLVYEFFEENSTPWSFIRSVWLDEEERVCVLEVFYDAISVVVQKSDTSFLLGSCDESLYSRMSKGIRRYDCLSEVIRRPVMASSRILCGIYERAAEKLVENVLLAASSFSIEGCFLHSFKLIDLPLSCFMAVTEILGVVDNPILFSGRKNIITIYSDYDITRAFYDSIFGGIFDIQLEV